MATPTGRFCSDCGTTFALEGNCPSCGSEGLRLFRNDGTGPQAQLQGAIARQQAQLQNAIDRQQEGLNATLAQDGARNAVMGPLSNAELGRSIDPWLPGVPAAGPFFGGDRSQTPAIFDPSRPIPRAPLWLRVKNAIRAFVRELRG